METVEEIQDELPYGDDWLINEIAKEMNPRFQDNMKFIFPELEAAGIKISTVAIAGLALDSIAEVFRNVRVIKNDDVRAVALSRLEANVIEYFRTGKVGR